MEIRRLRGRRAEANEEIMWLIGETLLVLVFAAAVFYWLISLQNDTLLEKNYLSRDLGLLIDSVYASPGNVEYEYSTNVVNITKFNFFFKDQPTKPSTNGVCVTIKSYLFLSNNFLAIPIASK